LPIDKSCEILCPKKSADTAVTAKVVLDNLDSTFHLLLFLATNFRTHQRVPGFSIVVNIMSGGMVEAGASNPVGRSPSPADRSGGFFSSKTPKDETQVLRELLDGRNIKERKDALKHLIKVGGLAPAAWW
jgi:hypothetical protein